MIQVEHAPPRPVLAGRVDAAGWGLGLLGVGGITVGVQLARKYVGVGAEPFWLAVGFLFVAGALAEFLNFEFGLALLVSALRRRAS